jgi:hypothetical protein
VLFDGADSGLIPGLAIDPLEPGEIEISSFAPADVANVEELGFEF